MKNTYYMDHFCFKRKHTDDPGASRDAGGYFVWFASCTFYCYCFRFCFFICLCLCLLSGRALGQNSYQQKQTAGSTSLKAPVFRFDQFGYVNDLPKRVVFVLPVNSDTNQLEPIVLDSFRVYRLHNSAATDTTYSTRPMTTTSASTSKTIPTTAQNTASVLESASQPLFEPTEKTFKNAIRPLALKQWFTDRVFYPLDLNGTFEPGDYQIKVFSHAGQYTSPVFKIMERKAFVHKGVGALLHYFRRQRANSSLEWAADAHLKLKGSQKRVDLRGGWCDASGDVSKYFSHLAYTNFMGPQQIPLVTWALIQATEVMGNDLRHWNMLDSIRAESLWGADYLMRSLSDSNYFYMTVFSYFKKDPSFREIVGLEANSVTTADYACAMREGAGMAIAALARISTWNQKGSFSPKAYLSGAERAYRHLLTHNRQYDDDGQPNIIDDYCGLMAATELWRATGKKFYKKQARSWAAHLCARYSSEGYLRADGPGIAERAADNKGTPRPFWHASDAGLPIVSLLRYLQMEKVSAKREAVRTVIQALLSSQLVLNAGEANPFDYPRQVFSFKGQLETGFFIPHENESGWWWQGENARLASLSTAAVLGEPLMDQIAKPKFNQELKAAAMHQLSWITGCNPYGICFLYGYGDKNVPYMHSNYGHGSELGGISNGITGLNEDGTGIAFREEDQGNEWRWTEQWLPHAAWYLQALTALEINVF